MRNRPSTGRTSRSIYISLTRFSSSSRAEDRLGQISGIVGDRDTRERLKSALFRCSGFPRVRYNSARHGEVAEWSNAAVSKTVEPLRVPGVRISPSPPSISIDNRKRASSRQRRSTCMQRWYILGFGRENEDPRELNPPWRVEENSFKQVLRRPCCRSQSQAEPSAERAVQASARSSQLL